MAVLKREGNEKRASIAGRSLIGRGERCVVRLASPRASGEHAVLFWSGEHWFVRDLGSTNGTLIDGIRIAVGERVQLREGAALVFGDPAERWVMADAGPPVASAYARATGEVHRAADGLLALPDAGNPVVTLFEDRYGRWMLDAGGTAREAVDQEVVDVGSSWVLNVPPAGDSGRIATTHRLGSDPPKLVEATTLRFELSRDGEYISLALLHAGRETKLGARAHHELLLLLAQARLRDRAAGLPAREQGWLYVDDLIATLRVDPRHFNVTVFRAREHLASAGVIDVGVLFERRSTTRQIRLGGAEVEIVAV